MCNQTSELCWQASHNPECLTLTSRFWTRFRATLGTSSRPSSGQSSSTTERLPHTSAHTSAQPRVVSRPSTFSIATTFLRLASTRRPSRRTLSFSSLRAGAPSSRPSLWLTPTPKSTHSQTIIASRPFSPWSATTTLSTICLTPSTISKLKPLQLPIPTI